MSRLEWIISGLLGLVIVAVVATILWNLNSGPQTALPDLPADAPVDNAATGRTAQEAYRLAQPVAQQWADDARLLSASATWPEGSSFTPDHTGWSMLFYSPGRSETGLISVSQGAARLLRNGPTDRALKPLEVINWQVDSPMVVEALMAQGGEEFLQTHNNATLSLTFSALDALQWQAQLIAREQRTVLTVEIDPISGAVTASNLPEGEE